MSIEKFGLSGNYAALAAPAPGPPRPRPGEHFLKGPVPLGWLWIAAQQPGRTMVVAIYIWYLAGLKKHNRFPLPTAKLDLFGVDRFTQNRALKKLAAAGLISVERHRGRHPVITIRAAPAKTAGGEERDA